MKRRLLPPLLGLVALCALLAACGGEEEAPGAAVASVPDASTASSDGDAGTGTASEGDGDEEASPKERQEAMLEFARCMRKNGVDMEDPKPGEGLALRVQKGQEKKMEKAQKACQPILRNAIGEPSAEERAAMEEAALEFARCMREHGVDVPDPKPGEGIRIGGPGSKLNPDDPSFQKAQKACEGIMRGAFKAAGGGDDDGPSTSKDGDG